jgi:hypothetical protein
MAFDLRSMSRACPDGPHAEFRLVDQVALQAVRQGADERYRRAEEEYVRLTGALPPPPDRIATDFEPAGSALAAQLYEEAAEAAGIPTAARRWVVPYLMAQDGWYLIQRPPHQMLLYGGLQAFERFGAPMAAELPFLADFARHARARFDTKPRPD